MNELYGQPLNYSTQAPTTIANQFVTPQSARRNESSVPQSIPQDIALSDPLDSQEFQKMNSFLKEQLDKLQETHDQSKKEYSDQKNFYEDALEARMKQIEEAEDEVGKRKIEIEQSRRKELEKNAQFESLKFDYDLQSQKINSGA